MSRRIDHATAYYWRIELIEPANPDDDRYVLLHGDEGEIVGPLTMQLAGAWMDHFDNRTQPGTNAGLPAKHCRSVSRSGSLAE